ncbi:hypothetical protein PIB30_084486 [Stylosanthes scabra]|uniref:Uncharacterized protein n=1 Tax=Stylosanthes scabra TaxID=79078 RepID=A0ABU6VR26_9FABA|nr:hypothetical protein [Stylosanthes scabra]
MKYGFISKIAEKPSLTKLALFAPVHSARCGDAPLPFSSLVMRSSPHSSSLATVNFVLNCSSLNGCQQVASLVTLKILKEEGGEGGRNRLAWDKWSNDGTERQVAKLMEENVGAAMQFLQSKVLKLLELPPLTWSSESHSANNNFGKELCEVFLVNWKSQGFALKAEYGKSLGKLAYWKVKMKIRGGRLQKLRRR